MDDDLLDVNCGRCGRPMVMRIDDLRDRRTVECADCAMRVRDGEQASTPSEGCSAPPLRLLPSPDQRRES